MFWDHFIDTKRKRYCLFICFALLLVFILTLFDLYLGIVLVRTKDSSDIFSLLDSSLFHKHYLVQYVFVMIQMATVSLSYIFSLFNILSFLPYTIYIFNLFTVYFMPDKKNKEGRIHSWLMIEGIINLFLLCFLMILTFFGLKSGLFSDVLHLIHLIGKVIIVVKVFVFMISLACFIMMAKQYREALQYEVIEEIKELSGV